MNRILILVSFLILMGCAKEVTTYQTTYITPLSPDLQYRFITFSMSLSDREIECFREQERRYIETILRHPVTEIWVNEYDSGEGSTVKHFICQ